MYQKPYKTPTRGYQAPTRATIPTPANATQALHDEVVEAYTQHFSKIIPAEVLIANRKASYATVINGTYNGVKMEDLLGSENAKIATEAILNTITATISVVPPITTPPATGYQTK